MRTCIKSKDRTAGPITRWRRRSTLLRSDTNNTSGKHVSFALDSAHLVVAVAVRPPWKNTNQP
jgi:hypothetical protein